SVWGAECELESCSSSYVSGTQSGIEEGPSVGYCSLVQRYIQCTTEYRSACRGNLQYHSIQRMLSTFTTRNNCTAILQSVGSQPFSSEGPPNPNTLSEGSTPDKCRYDGNSSPAFCSLFGDPHLKTFEDQYMTCGVRGAWPLINTPYLAIQVTNEAVGPDNTATATTKASPVSNYDNSVVC
ncbi:hypothetical protein SK128_000520, partial [Halocaridina rubra]